MDGMGNDVTAQWRVMIMIMIQGKPLGSVELSGNDIHTPVQLPVPVPVPVQDIRVQTSIYTNMYTCKCKYGPIPLNLPSTSPPSFVLTACVLCMLEVLLQLLESYMNDDDLTAHDITHLVYVVCYTLLVTCLRNR